MLMIGNKYKDFPCRVSVDFYVLCFFYLFLVLRVVCRDGKENLWTKYTPKYE